MMGEVNPGLGSSGGNISYKESQEEVKRGRGGFLFPEKRKVMRIIEIINLRNDISGRGGAQSI